TLNGSSCFASVTEFLSILLVLVCKSLTSALTGHKAARSARLLPARTGDNSALATPPPPL
ncbi:MAG: hypothetical protein ACRD41_17380, partial [Candidatus Acidiferrales bacterium]